MKHQISRESLRAVKAARHGLRGFLAASTIGVKMRQCFETGDRNVACLACTRFNGTSPSINNAEVAIRRVSDVTTSQRRNASGNAITITVSVCHFRRLEFTIFDTKQPAHISSHQKGPMEWCSETGQAMLKIRVWDHLIHRIGHGSGEPVDVTQWGSENLAYPRGMSREILRYCTTQWPSKTRGREDENRVKVWGTAVIGNLRAWASTVRETDERGMDGLRTVTEILPIVHRKGREETNKSAQPSKLSITETQISLWGHLHDLTNPVSIIVKINATRDGKYLDVSCLEAIKVQVVVDTVNNQ
ncbi:hypothetical protein EDB87DRAFT_1578261 [Lactarius vividus]|nr:hypothetical protein EDB87DRAFT_1578261 [Lactarius vividus]